MPEPDIQYFDRDATWSRPAGAVAVDLLAQAGGSGGTPDALGEDGQVTVKRFYAPRIPPEVKIEIGRGGRPGGRGGYVLVLTRLEPDPDEPDRPLPCCHGRRRPPGLQPGRVLCLRDDRA